MPSSPETGVAAVRPRATILGAYLEGWRRALRAPWLTVGLVALTFLTALPLALVLRGQLAAQLGASETADHALWNWDEAWATEFAGQAHGIGQTFTHEILGFGGVFATFANFADAGPLNPAIAGAAAVYIAAWVFLSGGILDRLARARPIRAYGFFAASGEFFVRFLRLAIVVGAAYWALFRWLHPLIFVWLWDRLIRDLTVERTALAIRVALYLAFFAALMAVNVVADFAKVRAVVEDRRGMIAALAAAWRFVRRRTGRVAGLYVLNLVGAVVMARIALQIMPQAWRPDWIVFLATEFYLVARVWIKLAFMASEVVFFQGELAHAQYTARPEPVWPDSPAVESIARQPD